VLLLLCYVHTFRRCSEDMAQQLAVQRGEANGFSWCIWGVQIMLAGPDTR
jgi:hypothetical protein